MDSTILLVEDDQDILNANARILHRHGYRVLVATSARSAIDILMQETPDLLILDIMLPDDSGYQICKTFRITSNNPVIFLSAKGDVQDKINGFKFGADYYLTKPYNFDELFAVIERLLEREQKTIQAQQTIITVGNLLLNLSNTTVYLDGRVLLLTKIEYKLLSFFMQNQNKAIDNETLAVIAWGSLDQSKKNVLKTHISRIKQKIECEFSEIYDIKTIYGKGYCFVRTEEEL